MKKIHIVLIIFLAVAFAIIYATIYNSDTYADFSEAKKNKGKIVQIIGKLNNKTPVIYDSANINPSLSFYMLDDKNNECKVLYYGEKPVDFEKLKDIVIVGIMNDSVFMAHELLLKCPSKYAKTTDEFSKYKSKSVE